MGLGPLGRERPLTAGDDGLFLGLNRPLVGAANAVRVQVNRESAIEQASVVKNNPDYEFTKHELESVRTELENEKARYDKLDSLGPVERLKEAGVDPSDLGPLEYFNPLDRSADRIFELQEHVEELEEKLENIPKKLTVESARPSDVEEAITTDIRDSLNGSGISKGPFIDDNGESVIITASIVGLNREKIEFVRDQLEENGYIVEDIEAIEI